MIDEAQINNWFTYHSPTTDQAQIYEAIRSHAREFAHIINHLVPDGADKSAALRQLRETVMTANAAVATAPKDPAPANPSLFAEARKVVRTEGPYQTATWPRIAGLPTPPPVSDTSLASLVNRYAQEVQSR